MKKILIGGYFVGMLLLTYVTAKAFSTFKSDNVEVKYRNYENELSDTEMAKLNVTPKENKKAIQKWQTKETRTKTLFGWETKIDTTEKPSTWYVDCNCGR